MSAATRTRRYGLGHASAGIGQLADRSRPALMRSRGPRRTLTVLAAIAIASAARAGGGPTRTAAEERDRERQERREAEHERAWKSQGKRAIPRLLTIACGNDADALDLVRNAADALDAHGADAARAFCRLLASVSFCGTHRRADVSIARRTGGT